MFQSHTKWIYVCLYYLCHCTTSVLQWCVAAGVSSRCSQTDSIRYGICSRSLDHRNRVIISYNLCSQLKLKVANAIYKMASDWRNYSAINSRGCSSWELVFNSSYPHGSLQLPSVTLFPGDPTSSSGLQSTRHATGVQTHSRQNTH